ncbi:hypothetical protein ABH930_007442 [Kitasatospora sp. GAS204A]|uniref:hypothetical protein n=1 Tax=unclassified Kitasatospora TaxID=2633591 RepID=UPI002473818F|nr:hypothetical protein [Kitasatospora sp. GAS204B]MDH6123067.1 hypothetical protein [Kitasatospora sp. GAS204B]
MPGSDRSHCCATLSAMEHLTVRGLDLPAQLTSLLAQGRWHHPGAITLAKVIPWFEDPLDFLTSAPEMEWESSSMDMFADDPSLAFFRKARGSTLSAPVELPWLDVEQAVFIAVNSMPGDDVALALDYRTDPLDPRVVGSDFWTNPRLCDWRIVAPAFSVFAANLGL